MGRGRTLGLGIGRVGAERERAGAARMARDEGECGPSRDAKARDAERAAIRDARLAEALRSNLKRRKDQARARGAASATGPSLGADGAAGAERSDDGR